MSADQPNIIGELVVVALKARDLPNIEVVGKQDPFCVFRLGETARRSKTDYRGGQRPIWDDQVNLPVPEKKTKMYIQVFDEDSKREDLICEGELDLSEVLREGEQDAWFPLKYRGKKAGEIYLEMTFYSARQPPKRQPTRLFNKARPQQRHLQQQQQQQQYAPYGSPYGNAMVPPVPTQSTSTPVTAASSRPSAGPPIYRPPPPATHHQESPAKPHMPPRMTPTTSSSTTGSNGGGGLAAPYPPRMTPSVSTGTAMSHGYPPQYGPPQPGGRPASYGGAPLGFHIPQQQPPPPAMPGFSFPEPQAMPAGGYAPSFHGPGGQPFAAHQAPYPPAAPGYPPPQPQPSMSAGYPPQRPQGYPPY